MHPDCSPSLPARFWAKVEKTDGCWIWTAGRDSNGYGRISNGRRPSIPLLATHVSWFLHYGRWPEFGCLHTCDYPPCVRPDHLFDGDRVANVADRAAKGRTARGEQVSGAKLTEALAIEILAKYVPRKVSQTKLAAEYGVHQMTISDLVRGATWQHLKRP